MATLSSAQLRERLAAACHRLIRIPSVTGDEKKLADSMARWARSRVGRRRVRRLGNSVVVGGPDGQRPCIALVGHLDTVPPSSAAPPPGRDGDRIVGLGASDMKGSLAVMQLLVETLNLDSLPFSVTLVLYDREEGPYNENGLQPVLEKLDDLRSIDLAIAMEPTDNTLQLGCLGALHARVVFLGRAAHSARPWQGENAIHKAGPFLCHLAARQHKEVDVEGLIFRESMSVTLASGGRARNVIPDRCELNLNYRFAPVDSAVDNAIAELEKVGSEADEVHIVDVAPPGPVPLANPVLRHLRGLHPLAVEPKQAWTDVARLATFGIDAVNFGPGRAAEAHQASEWISIEAMVHAYDILASLLTCPLLSARL